MTEEEIVEYLLLRSRGAVGSPLMRLFQAEIVASVFDQILTKGYLRRLDMIPALEIYPHAQTHKYAFSAAGRIRYYSLDPALIAAAQKTEATE